MTRLLPDSLNPATRVLWRGERTVQLELGDQALVVDGIPARTMRRLLARGPVSDRSSSDSTETEGQDPLTGLRPALQAGGFLWPRTDAERDERLIPPAPRLAGELGALTAQHGEQAAELLAARHYAAVAVHGPSRVGPHIAAILAAAGVGRTYGIDLGEARLHQFQPGGLGPSDEGTPLAAGAAAAIRRTAPEVDTTPLAPDDRPDLVVMAFDDPIDEDRRDGLHSRGWAHLPVSVGSSGGIVGPLVIPGLTSCLRCADLHRLDRDPAWNALAVQLCTPRRPRDGSAVALASTIAGVAAMQVLEFLDGGSPTSIDGTLELHPPDWRLRRRTRGVHPDCDCQMPAT